MSLSKFLVIMSLTALAVIGSLTGMSYAASTSNLATLTIDEDKFRNYDFLSSTDSSTNVDWPVTMIHWDDAEIDKVKTIYWGSTIFGDLMSGRINDGSSWVWDTDRGTKSGTVWSSDVSSYVHIHMRLYAPSSTDYLSNTSWGNYVIGTTHYDQYPETPGNWHGYSEYAENDFADHAISDGYSTDEDWSNFYNSESYRVEGDHRWLNGGYATAVKVP